MRLVLKLTLILIVGVNNTYDDGLVAWDQLRELKDPPTAFFAGNDEIAIGLIHGAQDNGLRSTRGYRSNEF